MKTPSSRTMGQFANLWKGISRGRRIAMVFCLAGTAVALTLVVLWTGQPDFTLLYANLSAEDAAGIASRLKEQKIPYQVGAGGHSILVPREQVYEIRMELAAQGLPQGGGIGFEIFDRTKLGMTDFVQNVNYQRALQGELIRTISGFSEVESARVHLVLPAKSLFKEKEEPASASVVLKLRPGRYLTRDQIAGILHLVSSSVSGLSPDNVTVVDTNGRTLSRPKEGRGLGQMSLEQLEVQEKLERGMEDRVKSMLEGVLGMGKAIVRVSCFMDFTRQERSSEKFLAENQVVRSEQVLAVETGEKGRTPAGVPGMASNSPTAAAAGASAAAAGASAAEGDKKGPAPAEWGPGKKERTVNYEIGKEVSKVVDPVSKISRISVAVVVDGTYKTVTTEPKKKGEKPVEEIQYVPRSDSEMDKLQELVRSAISFDEKRGDRISVVNIPFQTSAASEEGAPGSEKGWLSKISDSSYLIKQVFLAAFILLTFIFGVRPFMKWLLRDQGREGEMLLQLPRTVADMEKDFGEAAPGLLPYKERALEFLARDRDASLDVMKEWLKEGRA